MLHTKLLKKIIKYCRHKNYVFSAEDCLISVPEFDEALDCSFCYGQFESTMRYLIEENYIERVGKDFRLSYKALYRKEILIKKIVSICVNSILLPIFVSIVTTLLTLLVQALL